MKKLYRNLIISYKNDLITMVIKSLFLVLKGCSVKYGQKNFSRNKNRNHCYEIIFI